MGVFPTIINDNQRIGNVFVEFRSVWATFHWRLFKISERYQRFTIKRSINVWPTFDKRLPNDLLACKRLSNDSLTFGWRSHDVYPQGIKGRWQTPLSSFFNCISAVNYCIIIYWNHPFASISSYSPDGWQRSWSRQRNEVSQEACKKVFH